MARQVKERRGEIEGLRTIAALLVAVYHIWLDRVSGGVDVFFVVTGFFITMTLINQIERSGHLKPRAYLGRLIRRLWPAAMVVLIAATAMTVLFAPAAVRDRSFTEIIASALYFENWQLAFSAVDYLAADEPATAVQHFWAMSLQGQFYLIWLALAFGAVLIARRFGRLSARHAFAAVLGAVLVLSLAVSIWHTAVDQPFAYFSTFTRLWEFAVGGLLFLFLARLQLRGRVADVLSLIALVGLIACGLVLPVGASFPGIAALWPVACAALLLLSVRGPGSAVWAGSSILAWQPLVWLGKVSYGIYLWHWVLFTGYKYLRGEQAVPGVTGGVAILGGAILLAIATHYLIERPVTEGWSAPQRRRLVGGLVVAVWAVAAIAPAAGLTTFRVQAAAEARERAEAAAEAVRCIGYGALEQPEGACATVAPEELLPSLATLKKDTNNVYECYSFRDEPTKPCELGDEDASTRAAIIGNSHGAVLAGGIRDRLDEVDWNLTTFTGYGCMLGKEMRDPPSENCAERWTTLESALFDDEPFDVVILAGGRGGGVGYTEADLESIRDLLDRLDAVGSQVVIVEDNPRPGDEGLDCLASATEATLLAGACDFTEAHGFTSDDRFLLAAEGRDDVIVVRTQDMFCEEGTCPFVIGGVIVYNDAHHVSATYTRTLMPEVFERLGAQTTVAAP